MSTDVITGAVASDGPSDNTPPPASAPTYYQTVIEERIKELWQIAAKLPKFTFGHPDDLLFVRTHKNVPIEGLELVVSNVQQTPELQKAIDTAQAQEDLQFMQAYRAMIAETEKFLDGLRFSHDFPRAQLTGSVQKAVNVTKAMSRLRGFNHIAATYKVMKEATKRKRKGSEAKTSPQSPPPIVTTK